MAWSCLLSLVFCFPICSRKCPYEPIAYPYQRLAEHFFDRLGLVRLRLQRFPAAGRADHVRVVRGAQPIPAACRFGAEANFEQETLTRVIEARAKATSFQITPEVLTNPQALQQFQSMQGELSSALSRLMVVSEQYPNLKANQGFADLRVQLEGTENRITVARNRYITAVKDYNVLARSFPSNLTAKVFGYAPKANFSVANEAAISAPPKVDFGK